MKKLNMFLALAGLALLLAACSNNENENELVEQEPINFIANISEVLPPNAPSSRMYDQTWEYEDEIGIHYVGYTDLYKNVHYSKLDAQNTFTSITKMYYQHTLTSTFTGYYPYAPTLADDKVTFDTHNQSQQKNFDFLFGTGTGSPTSNTVTMLFEHKMSKLILKIYPGAETTITTANITENGVCSMDNLFYEGDFNISDGTISAKASELTASSFIFTNNSETESYDVSNSAPNDANYVQYSLILRPQQFTLPNLLKFKLAIDGKDYIADLDFSGVNGGTNELMGKKAYTVSITIHSTGAFINSFSIEDWDDKNLVADADEVTTP